MLRTTTGYWSCCPTHKIQMKWYIRALPAVTCGLCLKPFVLVHACCEYLLNTHTIDHPPHFLLPSLVCLCFPAPQKCRGEAPWVWAFARIQDALIGNVVGIILWGPLVTLSWKGRTSRFFMRVSENLVLFSAYSPASLTHTKANWM